MPKPQFFFPIPGCQTRRLRVYYVLYRLVELPLKKKGYISYMKLEWKTCWKVGLSAFLLYLAIRFWPAVGNLLTTLIGAASPLIIGCLIAYILNILMTAYERHYFPKSTKTGAVKSRRPVCMIAAMVTLAAIIALVAVLIVPQLAECVALLVAEIPAAAEFIIAQLDKLDFVSDSLVNTLEGIDWNSRLNDILSSLGSVVDVVMSTVVSVFSGVVTAFLAIIFAVYLLASKEKLARQCDRLMYHGLRSRLYDQVLYVLRVLNDCFRKYIVGQCTEAVILGGLCTLGMLIFRLPYATMIGALIAFTALIPVAGAYIGAGVGAFIILMVSPVKALWFLVFILILQQIEGNIIYPKVVGSSLGLPALWVLAAVTIGGGIFGIAGMLLGVPLAAAVYRILKEHIPPKPVPDPAPAPVTSTSPAPPESGTE